MRKGSFRKQLHILLIVTLCFTLRVVFPEIAFADPSSKFKININYANCLDGIDNDSDGFTDYPEDSDCASETDNSESTYATLALSGWAYPLSNVSILKDGQVAVTTIAGQDAKFTVFLTGISEGGYTFSLRSEDSEGRLSSLFSFYAYLSEYTTTFVSGIFISPTIELNKTQLKKGDDISFFGQSLPNSQITIAVHSEEEHLLQVTASASGAYNYTFDTSPLEYGTHLAKSKSSANQEVSTFSSEMQFIIDDDILNPAPACRKADLNCDGRVNLVDFSIEAFWYRRASPPTAYDLNADGKIDIVDFSIMAFYWTG
jgi:hypothetical protein